MFSSSKSRLAALLLCWFLGIVGAHRFYVGKFWTGLIQLVTAGGFGIWWFIDLVLILLGAFSDADGRPVTKW